MSTDSVPGSDAALLARRRQSTSIISEYFGNSARLRSTDLRGKSIYHNMIDNNVISSIIFQRIVTNDLISHRRVYVFLFLIFLMTADSLMRHVLRSLRIPAMNQTCKRMQWKKLWCVPSLSPWHLRTSALTRPLRYAATRSGRWTGFYSVVFDGKGLTDRPGVESWFKSTKMLERKDVSHLNGPCAERKIGGNVSYEYWADWKRVLEIPVGVPNDHVPGCDDACFKAPPKWMEQQRSRQKSIASNEAPQRDGGSMKVKEAHLVAGCTHCGGFSVHLF